MKVLKLIIGLPFAFCVLFLRLLGKCLGLTYQQISIVFNLWIQGAVLVLASIMPLLQFLDHSRMRMNLSMTSIDILKEFGYHCIGIHFIGWMILFILFIVYALIYIALYIWMLYHYRLPWSQSFNRCVKDLEAIAREWHCSYKLVNLIIFVLLFLYIIAFNYILVKLIGFNIFIVT